MTTLPVEKSIVRIRSVIASHGNALTATYSGASTGSLRMRFFAVPTTQILVDEVARLCRPADTDHAWLRGLREPT